LRAAGFHAVSHRPADGQIYRQPLVIFQKTAVAKKILMIVASVLSFLIPMTAIFLFGWRIEAAGRPRTSSDSG
jgi:hypothetical protein